MVITLFGTRQNLNSEKNLFP